MTKLTKSLLILGIAGITSGIAFSVGLMPAGSSSAGFVCLAFGAIFFGLFMISMTLQDAAAEYDMEQQESFALVKKQVESTTIKTRSFAVESISGSSQAATSAH